MAPELLVALAPRLEPAQAKRVWEAEIVALERSNDSSLPYGSSSVLGALARRVEASETKRGYDALMAVLKKGPQGDALAACEGLDALASFGTGIAGQAFDERNDLHSRLLQLVWPSI